MPRMWTSSSVYMKCNIFELAQTKCIFNGLQRVSLKFFMNEAKEKFYRVNSAAAFFLQPIWRLMREDVPQLKKNTKKKYNTSDRIKSRQKAVSAVASHPEGPGFNSWVGTGLSVRSLHVLLISALIFHIKNMGVPHQKHWWRSGSSLQALHRNCPLLLRRGRVIRREQIPSTSSTWDQ